MFESLASWRASQEAAMVEELQTIDADRFQSRNWNAAGVAKIF